MEPGRRALLGAGLLGLGATAGCSSYGGGSDGSSTSASGSTLGKTSDIPVGGGKIFASEKIVVTQPTAGQFKAFSAVCTHQGCTVGSVSSGTIDCPCHGSQFKIADGSVAKGPAATGLPEKQITVSGTDIKLA